MRMLSKKQVTAIILYSAAHIARLEADNKFPRRVKLGPSRVGWIEQEVLDWLAERIARRTP